MGKVTVDYKIPSTASRSSSVRFSRLHNHFGLRVEGIDICSPIDDVCVSTLRWAFESHSLLVFPDQSLEVDQLTVFAEHFGPIDVVKVGSVGVGTNVSWVGNVENDGTLTPEHSRLWFVTRANQLWHSDGSYKARPPMASLMHAEVVPPSGGETEFVSMRAVWNQLPNSRRSNVLQRVAIHSYATSRDKIHPDLMTAEERDVLPPVCHPMVIVNPATEVPALFIGSHVSRVQNMSSDESDVLLAELVSFATAERFVYRHVWNRHDLVLWDNRSVIHRGRPWDMSRFPRRLAHVSILESEPPAFAQL